MRPTDLMRGAPPPPQAQVTLANWRQAPFSSWSFHNLRRVLPTEALPVERYGPAYTLESRDLHRLPLTDQAGRSSSLSAVLEQTYTTGFLVLHRGRLVFEWYDRGLSARRPHVIFSVTKSVTGALAGILADRGLLDPEAPVADLLPEVAGSAYEDATLRHLLDMTVGSGFVEDYENPTPEYLAYRAASAWNPSAEADRVDLRSFLSGLSKGGPPHGYAFHYVSPNSDLLGWAIERAAGKSYAELLAEEIWQPMGAEGEAYITIDRLGAPRTAGGLCVTGRDLARFGELMRLGGCLNGKQILPHWWLEDIHEAGDRDAWQRGNFAEFLPQGRYRSQWYQLGDDDGTLFGIGIHGQWLFIDPAQETVIVKFSADPVASNDSADRDLVSVFKSIGRALNG